MNQPQPKKLELKKATLLRLTEREIQSAEASCKLSCMRTRYIGE